MMKERISLGFVISAAVAIAVAVVVSDQFIYKSFVVPRLNEIKYVPITWWIAVYSPVLICCVLVGTLSNNLYSLAFCAVLASVLNRIYNGIAAITGQPGHLKSSAVEAPLDFWVLEFFGVVLLYSVLLLIGLFINKLRKKKGS
jgi:hypothetical protein